MSWYAVRTLPGAQQPKREYWAEDAPRTARGYRVRSGVASDWSAVELALEDAGITHYMPAEFAVVRNRHRAGLYELRRLALLKGYVFVGDLTAHHWTRLTAIPGTPDAIPGVRGVVGNCGRPLAISSLDLFRLRMYEASSRAAAEARAASLSRSGERLERERRKKAARGARQKLFPGRSVRLIWGDRIGREATVQAWQDQEHVRVLLRSLDGASETLTVPYEFLKAGS